MKILSWEQFVHDDSSGRHTRYAATVGVFDGVHRGHERLMKTVVARGGGLIPLAVTFAENPKKILHPASFKGDLQSLSQKKDAIEEQGIAVCVLIDFSVDFGTLSGAEFLALLEKSGVRHLCVGPNFRCGHHMDTNAEMLADICAQRGVEAVIADPVLHGGHPISSSRIRQAIIEGRLEDAHAMLGRHFSIRLETAGSLGLFKASGDIVLPPEGLYEVRVLDHPGAQNMVMSLGGGKISFPLGVPERAREIAILNMVSKV